MQFEALENESIFKKFYVELTEDLQENLSKTARKLRQRCLIGS